MARRTALGRAVQEYLDRGELVPDQVVLDMVREELIAAKAAGGGFVLDGIPRNMPQARATYLIARELGMTGDVALHLQAGDAELMRRLLARGILVSVDAMRSAHQVGREILAALEAMRSFVDQVPGQGRLPVDLTTLGDAFGAAGTTAGTSEHS